MQHFRFDSYYILDEPATILKEVEDCLKMMEAHKWATIFLRRPLSIERGIRLFDEDRIYARVTCRWTLVKPPESPAENESFLMK